MALDNCYPLFYLYNIIVTFSDSNLVLLINKLNVPWRYQVTQLPMFIWCDQLHGGNLIRTVASVNL